jgi:hypothetical protein
MNNHSMLGLVDVFAATLPALKFRPGIHVTTPRPFCQCGMGSRS